MASASSLLSEEQFMCSICLDVFTDPISTPCGHNYCKTCITQHWDSTNVWKCPLCQETFYSRPNFSVNKVLSEMADQLRKSQHSSTNLEPAEPDEVSCDVCTEPKLKAVKSCLACLASYCETHLEPHQRGKAFKRHKLINPVKNLEDILCKKHDRPLELFCKTDHTCVCQFCTEADHKLHQIVSLKEAYEGKKAELGKTEAEVQQMIQERQVKIQEVKHSVQLSNKDADREIADSVKVFTALISCIERSQAELMNVIEEKKKTTEKQAEGFIKELQQEISQLKKRSSELKQLLHTEDHLQLLQNFTSINTPVPSKDWTKVSVHPSSYVGTVRTAVDQLKKTLSEEMKKQSHITTQVISMVKPHKEAQSTAADPRGQETEVSVPFPQRGQETEVNDPFPQRGQETEFSVPFPLSHFVYLNQACREEMKLIERENGVTITAELKVFFEVDRKNNRSSLNPERALAEFTNLAQKRLGDFGSVTVPLKHANQGDWKRMLQNIQREDSKLVLTACCGEMTVSGPSKSVGDVRESLQISQGTLTNASFSAAASQQDRHRTTQEIGMVKKDPSVSGGLEAQKVVVKLEDKSTLHPGVGVQDDHSSWTLLGSPQNLGPNKNKIRHSSYSNEPSAGTATVAGATAAGETKDDCPICLENRRVFQDHDKTKTKIGHSSYSNEPSAGTATVAGATAAGETKENCPICLENRPQMEKLKCGHELCKECKIQLVKILGPVRPVCKDIFGKIEGDQPHGTMTWKSSGYPSLPGFPHCGTITINYNIPGGTQTEKHPNPGKRYYSTQRTAYLPDNKEGNEVVRLLKKAFDQKLIFTVGTSVTTGSEDQVTWNDIHHKTNMRGGPQGFGYPDDGYLSRVKAELKAKGIE